MIKTTYNYHMHTKRCGHAIGSDEEYLIEALNIGIKDIGFSDHQEIDLKIGVINEYISSLKELREKYKDKFDSFKIGIEFSYVKEREIIYQRLKEKGIEYFILGQHEFHTDIGVINVFSQIYCKDDCKYYVDELIRSMETGYFSYVAHPDVFVICLDKITNTERGYFRRICEKAKELDLPLEINLSGFSKNYYRVMYPNEEFFKIAGEVGNKVIIGYDAHYPKAYQDYPIEIAKEWIKKYKLKEVTKI